MRKFIILIASGFYSGYAPVASGTFGTAVGILVFLLLMHLSPWMFLLATVVLMLMSFWFADEAQKIYQELDCGKITIDEIVGYLFTLAFIPVSTDLRSSDLWVKVILAFFLFRLTDILKPPPARWIDRNVKNGAGVVLDDVFAGLYANLLLRGALWALARWHA